jgi:hypothetical protein
MTINLSITPENPPRQFSVFSLVRWLYNRRWASV